MMYRVAQASAAQLGVGFTWQQRIVEGADHSNAKMAPAAASLIE
jgi:hypothetical protein